MERSGNSEKVPRNLTVEMDPHELDISQLHDRKHLVMSLLEDRRVLRMLVAPMGFGKTSLVRAYAATVFQGGDVRWIDGSDPAFICLLDDGRSPEDGIAGIERWYPHHGDGRDDDADGLLTYVGDDSPPPPQPPALMVIEDIPSLGDERAEALSAIVDSVIDAGAELIITAVPSNDCLSALQADRVVVSSLDFIVSDEEYQETMGATPDFIGTSDLRELVYGIPSLVWTNSENALAECIRGVFSERLPSDILLPAAVMLLLQGGRFPMIEHLGIRVTHEVKEMLARSYPMFGVDPRMDTFSTLRISPADIGDLVSDTAVSRQRWYDVLECVVEELTETGDLQRAVEVLVQLCCRETRVSWLEENAWDLIDTGHFESMQSLIDSLPEADVSGRLSIASSNVFLQYLSGNRYSTMFAVSDMTSGVKPTIEMLPVRMLIHLVSGFDDGPGSPFELIGTGLTSRDGCGSMECLSSESVRRQGCPYGISEERGLSRCAGWNLVFEVLRRRGAFEETSTSNEQDGQCGSGESTTPYDLVEPFQTAVGIQNSAAYRLALHLAFVGCCDDGGHTWEELRKIERLMTDAILPAVKSDVCRITEAFLIRDLDQLTVRNGRPGSTDRQAERVLTHASKIHDRVARAIEDDASMRNVLMARCPIPSPIESDERGDEVASGIPHVSTVVVTERERKPQQMYLRLFGGFEMYLDGTLCTDPRWIRRKLRELLARVSISRGRDISREALMHDLWPKLDELHARDSFYTLWRQFRLLCGVGKGGEVPYVIRTESSCRANRLYLNADVMEFDALTREITAAKPDDGGIASRYREMERLYRGELLLNDPAGENCIEERVWYESMFIDTMIKASEHAVQDKDSLSAIWFARRALDESRGREDIYRALMRAQILAGQRTGAVQTFEACRRYLSEELGITPARKTLDLYHEAVSPLFRTDNLDDLGWKL